MTGRLGGKARKRLATDPSILAVGRRLQLARWQVEWYTIISMKKIRAWLAYSLYALVLGVIFFYILFPAEAVSRYIVARVAAVYPDAHLTIDDVSPILPPGLKLHQVTIGPLSGDALEAPEVRLYPRWLSLLGKQPAVTYTAFAGQGNIRGAATVTDAAAGPRLHLDADLDGVRIEQLGRIPAIVDYRLQGSVSGRIRYTREKQRTADVQVTVTDVTMTPPRPVLGVRKVRFESVRTEATLENRNLKVTRLILAGRQVSGELTGDISLGRQLKDSTLSLGGTLRLSLRAEGSGSADRQDSGISLSGSVPVRIEGTLGNPKVLLQ